MEKQSNINEIKDEEINTIDVEEEDEEKEKLTYTNILTILNDDNFNLQKIIKKYFAEVMGETLLRFLFRQIIKANEILDRQYYIHFNISDINPDNLLINNNLVKKLLEYSLLSKIKEKKIGIPGGYLTLEFYIDPNESTDKTMKQNYFVLGSTLFFLKYNTKLLNYKKSDDKKDNALQKLDILLRQKSYIKSNVLTEDKNFIDFLCSLFSFNPKVRPSFGEIYTNKWLNEDIETIEEIVSGFENENNEEKLIMELQKRDYLIKKENETKNESNKRSGRHCKFRYKKK